MIADVCKEKKGGKRKLASKRTTRENKKVIQMVDIAEALIKSSVPNGAHQHMVTRGWF